MKNSIYTAGDNRPQSTKKRGKKKAFGSPIKIKRKKNEVAIDVDTLSNLDVSEVTKRKIRTQRMLASAKMTALSSHSTAKMLKKSADRILHLSQEHKHNGHLPSLSSSSNNQGIVGRLISTISRRKIHPYSPENPTTPQKSDEKNNEPKNVDEKKNNNTTGIFSKK